MDNRSPRPSTGSGHPVHSNTAKPSEEARPCPVSHAIDLERNELANSHRFHPGPFLVLLWGDGTMGGR